MGKWRDTLTAYGFLAPAMILTAIFGIFPIGYAVYMSLYRWRLRQGRFKGLDNYLEIIGSWSAAGQFFAGLLLLLVAAWVAMLAQNFRPQRWFFRLGGLALAVGAIYLCQRGWGVMIEKGDAGFLQSLITTLYYSLSTVPIQIIIGLGIAYLLFQNIKGKTFFRILYFLPYITPVVAGAVVFRIIFSQRETGLANQFIGIFCRSPEQLAADTAWWRFIHQSLHHLCIEPQKWLAESKPITELLFGGQIFGWQLEGIWAGPSLALLSIAVFGIWQYAGYNAVILLAGLSAIPRSFYEAAEVDGANRWQIFRTITVPLLSPFIFYLAITGFIGTFQAFNHTYVMRDRFARGSVNVTSIEIFDSFYLQNKFGYAAAESIFLFFIILLLTIANFTIFNRRVVYD